MCGIVGIWDTRGRREIDAGALARMNAVQAHRGPDGSGEHRAPGIGLGHRRLAVIDVALGQQPLASEDGQVVIVFNGEIYNYRELAAELAALGHRFRTRSDTEVIVHAWQAWGEDCVTRLRGMFAFGLWDEPAQTLFLARDRMGVKPLHYALLPGGMLLFGSELKALLAHGGMDRGLDDCAIDEYFALGYVPEPRTIFAAARKLPPAHTLRWRRGQPPVLTRYWALRFGGDARITRHEAQAELVERLRQSVALRMVSEVPLGAFLSGGVDSSAVVAMMAGLSHRPVATCSIAFDDPAYDESAYARQVAERYGASHVAGTVRSGDFDLVDTLAALYDEPFADSSAIPTYRVCELARRRVTVALSGDGGDECFGGYRRYARHLFDERLRSMPPVRLARPLLGWLGRRWPLGDGAPRVLRARSTFEGLARGAVEAYFHGVSLFRDDMRGALYSTAFRRRLAGHRALDVFTEHARQAGTDDPLALIQYLDFQTYLVGDINTKVDRASMAHSLEVREPLMDHPLLEWAATLPSHWKVHRGEGKWLMKKALAPHLPHALLYRPKMGFAVPVAQWFRGPLRQRVEDALLGSTLRASGLFDAAFLLRLLHEHTSGRRDHSGPLWALLMFDAFLRRQAHDATPAPAAPAAAACSPPALATTE